MRELLTFLLLIFFSVNVFSQRNFNEAKGFSQHLVKLQHYDDAVTVLKEFKSAGLSVSQYDSLNHLIGFAYYLDKNLDSSTTYLDNVSSRSSLYYKSSYYSVISSLNKGKHAYNAAEAKLLSVVPDNETRQLWLTEYAGIMLLERNYTRFDSLSKYFDHSLYAVSNEQKELEKYYQGMLKVKKKSPLLAGTLSAVIPGMGKFYAGYRGKALSSFISVSALALVATESYFRDGVKSPSFIIFSGLFSVFYVGNIWGSTLSVRIKQDETFREFDRNILLDLHIPLRRLYN